MNFINVKAATGEFRSELFNLLHPIGYCTYRQF